VRKLIYLFIILASASCRLLNPSLMFKEDNDYKFATMKDTVVPEYRISPNDRFTFNISANGGYKLIDNGILGSSTSTVSGTLGVPISGSANSLEYLVDKDGYAKLPQFEKVYLKGKTVPEAEKMLEEMYSEYYKSPFIILKVINKRVIIFPGSGGAGISLTLVNDNTSLLEALALAGGIQQTGKAFRIKLIRGGLTNPQIYLVDLSTIDAMKSGDIVLQANDIIYVEPVRNTSQGVLAQISPIVGIITALLLVYQISKTK
jgi:polysaccharide export outer membrane protein